MYCSYCGKVVHTEHNCYKKRNDERAKKQAAEDQAQDQELNVPSTNNKEEVMAQNTEKPVMLVEEEREWAEQDAEMAFTKRDACGQILPKQERVDVDGDNVLV